MRNQSRILLAIVVGAAVCLAFIGFVRTPAPVQQEASVASVVEATVATNVVDVPAVTIQTNVQIHLFTELDLSGFANVPTTNVVRKPSGKIRTSEIQ